MWLAKLISKRDMNMEANNNLGRPPEAGALSNAEHQMLWRNRQKNEIAALRVIVSAVMATDPEIRELFVEKGYGSVIERAESANNNLT